MKDDTPQGKKSQREEKPFPSDGEDVDFEILDALEQLENAGPLAGEEDQSGDDQMVELALDEEDITFEEDDLEGESGFRFDESVTAGLEEELFAEGSGFDLDESLGEDLVKDIQTAPDDSFAIDLDQEDVQFDEEDLALDDSSFDMSSAETLVFNYDDQETSGIEISAPDMDASMEPGEYDLDLDSSDTLALEQEDLGIKDELAGLSDTDISIETEPFEEPEDVSLELDLSDFDVANEEEEALNIGTEGIEFGEGFADLGADIGLDESSDVDREIEELQGQDTVASIVDASIPEIEESESADIDQEETPLAHDVMLDLHDEEEQEIDEDFMESFEDIDINLDEEDEEESDVLETQESIEEEVTSIPEIQGITEEEVTPVPEPQGTGQEEFLPEEVSREEQEDEVELNDDESLEADDLEMEDFIEGVIQETSEEEVSPEPEEEDISAMPPAAEDKPEGLQEPVEEQISDREFLNLTLRLNDEQLQDFETMVNEAKTLQHYLDGLEENQSEIKDSIYRKLNVEYIERKTVIFQSDTFTNLFTDVEQDLQDILAKRTDIVTTVERLNEELEEIKVRHLVGEYDDATLAEKEEAQKSEIFVWNEKTKKIEGFISRYQESLNAEIELNPLRQEQETEVAPLFEAAAESPDIPEEFEEAISPEEPEMSDVEEESEAEDLPEEIESENIQEEPEADEFPEESVVADASEEAEDISTFEPEPEAEQLPEDVLEDSEEEDSSDELFTIGEDIDEFDSEFPMDSDFESGEFELDELSGFEGKEEGEEEEGAVVSYDVDAFVEEPETDEEPEAATITCKKCKRQTPIDQKFCVHCGGKAQ